MNPLVSAGTRVVVTTEARGTNAMPTRTPAGAEVNYPIRFADGFETWFTREEFESLNISKTGCHQRSTLQSGSLNV